MEVAQAQKRQPTSPEAALSTVDEEEYCGILLQQVINYARPRVDYHIESLCKEFSRDPRLQFYEPSGFGNHIVCREDQQSQKIWSEFLWRDHDFIKRTQFQTKHIDVDERQRVVDSKGS